MPKIAHYLEIEHKITVPLEVLVATQDRTNLDFLHDMFCHNDLSALQVLIVNQTKKEKILVSQKSNIRVINSFERGLSKSRNLAIQNAVGEICLLADDDVVYLKGFDKVITKAYKENDPADVITFKTLTTRGKPYYKNYPKKLAKLDGFAKKVLSIEISFKLLTIKKRGILFDERFGLGAQFEDGENKLFFREVLKNKLCALFYPEYIVTHKDESSSDDISSDRFMYSRSALNYKLHGTYAYIYILKLTFALLRRNLIGIKNILPKICLGLKGINDYKKPFENAI